MIGIDKIRKVSFCCRKRRQNTENADLFSLYFLHYGKINVVNTL